MKLNKIYKSVTLTLSLSLLAACGGSSSSSDTPESDLTWVAGEFSPRASFVNKCEVVRTGTDPYNDDAPYPDTAGSLEHEKMWLRSWSHESYLWYDEVEDVDPADFATPQAYFDVLKTTATTESGSAKDNFHFYRNTAEYNESSQGGTSSGYGIRWVFGSTTVPRELTVVQTEPNSPAEIAGFQRGDTILELDGVDFINGNDVDTLNAGIYPSTDGEIHTFKVKDVFGVEKTLSVTSGKFTISPVKATSIFEHAGNTVGYIQFDTFNVLSAQEPLIEQFSEFRDANINELVVDLRYNGGGYLATSSQLAYMIAGDNNTNNRVFNVLRYNGKWQDDSTYYFYDRKINWDTNQFTDDLPSVALNKVYILSSGSTCSASEALINGLRGIDLEVVLIGDQTCGKPYGFVPTDNCSTTYFTIQFGGENDKGFGEYSDGFIPTESPQFQTEVQGCSVIDDLTRPLGDISEGMLSAALFHMETGNCPAETRLNLAQQATSLNLSADGLAIQAPDERMKQMLENNAIITPPPSNN